MLKSGVVTPNYIDLLGLPFVRGARGPEGYDCYGLVKEMYRRAGQDLPDFTAPGTLENVADVIEDQTHRWKKVAPRTIGSLVTIRVEGLLAHVGYVIERDRFIHAVDPIGVTTERITNGSFNIIGYYDYV